MPGLSAVWSAATGTAPLVHVYPRHHAHWALEFGSADITWWEHPIAWAPTIAVVALVCFAATETCRLLAEGVAQPSLPVRSFWMPNDCLDVPVLGKLGSIRDKTGSILEWILWAVVTASLAWVLIGVFMGRRRARIRTDEDEFRRYATTAR